jgi:phenylpyruvate tautomerase PptA (4-oxalocrotonate tautomerase family)
MPTYNVFATPVKLTAEKKKQIADCLTTVYNQEFGLPRYLTQVIFYEVAKDDHYIAGKPARPDVVWIRCDIREGRNEQMKAKLLQRVQQVVAKAADVPEEAVWIYFCDLPPEDIMEWGTSCHPSERCPMTTRGFGRCQVLSRNMCRNLPLSGGEKYRAFDSLRA